MRCLVAGLLAMLLSPLLPGSEALINQSWFPKAPPLPKPKAPIIRVDNVDALFAAARNIPKGGTILLADGHYWMPRYFALTKDGITLRSASGRRERVILDGARSMHGELVGITGASDVTIADLTIQNIKWNGFKINSDSHVQRVTIRNCVIHNIWQRGVKGVRVPKAHRPAWQPAGCRIQYCLFYNDRPKTYADDPADTARNFRGNYIGGIDVMYPKDWVISHNVFIGIRGRSGEARGAVFLWHEAEGCVIEKNIIINCDSGICLGNSHKPADVAVHATGCVVRNNFLTRVPENGILADYTRNCRILHNTVHDPKSRMRRLIRMVHDNDGLLVANNLLSGPPPSMESRNGITIKNNLVKVATDAFVNPKLGNLHIKSSLPEAANSGILLPDVPDDIDGTPRREKHDLGAHEFRR